MAYAQLSLQVEIQSLKDALAASQKKADRYARMVATLTVELDDLRNSICDSCKKKLAYGNPSVPLPTISPGQDSTGTTPSVSAPLWRRVFEDRHRARPTTDNILSIGLSRSLAASPNTKILPLVPSDPDVAHNLGSSRTTPSAIADYGPHVDIISPEQKTRSPKWSVVYHPEVERAIELHLAHTFTYDSPGRRIKMSPDGQRLAVGLLGDGKTYLKELETGSNICVFVDRYVKDLISIISVKFSPNGQILATGGNDFQIRLWNIAQKRMGAMLKGHKYIVQEVAFSPDGRSLVSASADRSVRIWRLRDGSSKVLPVIGSPRAFTSVAFSPDGRYIGAGNFDRSLWIWDSRTRRLVAKWWGHTFSVSCTEFTPDGKGLISGSSDNTVKYWDLGLLGNRRGVSTVNEEQSLPLVRSLLGHDAGVNSVAFFPGNNQWIVTGSDDQSVRVWDIESGDCRLTLHGHTDLVRGVDVSRTQDFLATAGQDGRVTVWKYRLL